MQNKKDKKWVITKIDDFLIFLKTQMKVHKTKSEFVSHFTNWLPKNMDKAIARSTYDFHYNSNGTVRGVL